MTLYLQAAPAVAAVIKYEMVTDADRNAGPMCGAPEASPTEMTIGGVTYGVWGKGSGGLLLPLFGNEWSWPKGVQVIVYLMGLLWSFLAVGIIADIFMEAIEVITSQERKHHLQDGAVVKLKVWNATVANLTLMALGSSAPEILLSVLEIMQNKFFSGSLGPSTIVGSAAFNMLVILAVCCSCMPAGETRLIADLVVYGITAVSSLFAYIWLLIILQIITPNKVDVWEGVLTFLFFPVLVIMAYGADKGWFHGGTKVSPESRILDAEHPDWNEEDTRKLIKQYKDAGGTGNVDDPGYKQFVKIMMVKNHKPSRAALRINAIRSMTGGKRVIGDKTMAGLASTHAEILGTTAEAPPLVQWASTVYTTYESGGHVELTIERHPSTGVSKVKYETVDAGPKENKHFATGGDDYVITNEECVFADGESTKTIKIGIIDDDQPEEDEHFFCQLTALEGCSIFEEQSKTKIIIVDDDEPGQMGFDEADAKVIVSESCGSASIIVNRHNGSKGEISCSYETVETGGAVAGKDFTAASGRVTFAPYQMKATIQIEIADLVTVNKHVDFKVVLGDPKGPTDQVIIFKNDAEQTMGECAISIANDDKAKELIDATNALVAANTPDVGGPSTWGDQFKAALAVNGGDDDEPDGKPGTMDYVMHALTLPWKLMFATVAPTHYWGGWLCFGWALAYIGFVTALIGDLAGLFGCALGLEDAVTAITFVALGTSLPDTFASKAATLSDDTADAAIGNVTGSNSVNVFLGLGLPWMMASIYWSMKDAPTAGLEEGSPLAEWYNKYSVPISGIDGTILADYPSGGFIVLAGDLGFSVTVFTCCSMTCMITLALRRKYLGAELGGDKKWNTITSIFFLFLWLIYVIFSSLKVYGDI